MQDHHACYKNPNKPVCIDLILADSPKWFMKTQTLETGLSLFCKLMFTVLKTLRNQSQKLLFLET